MKHDQHLTGHGFADPTHRERYWELLKRGTTKSLDITAPWLKRQVLDRLPNVRREFDMNRDPLIRNQMVDGGEGETGNQLEQLDEESWFIEAPRHEVAGSRMVKTDRPQPVPPPPQSTRHAVNRAAFNERWLDEHWRDISARIVEPETANGMTQERGRAPQSRLSTEPSW